MSDSFHLLPYTHESKQNFLVRGNLEHMLPTLTAVFPLCVMVYGHGRICRMPLL